MKILYQKRIKNLDIWFVEDATQSTIYNILNYYLRDPYCIAPNQYGKPQIITSANTTLHFNLSHTKNCSIYAISKVAPLGIDIEYIHRMIHDPISLAKRFFHDNDYLLVKQSLLPVKTFILLWIMKEAVLKMTGTGLKRHLKYLYVIQPMSNIINVNNMLNHHIVVNANTQQSYLVDYSHIHDDYAYAISS